MTTLSLNPQLGGRLKAIQEAWGHDNPSETLGTILDSSIYGWAVPPPCTPEVFTGRLAG